MLRNAIRMYATGSAAKRRIGVIGVPFAKGQSKSGVDMGPRVMRESGLIGTLTRASGCEIKDYGDLEYQSDQVDHLDNMNNFSEVLCCNETLASKVKTALEENDQYLTIGGDHSIGFGSIAGHLIHDPNIAVIWVDAHADVNLNVTSHSGNIHGMPVALLLHELRQYWDSNRVRKIAPKCLPAKHLVYIGLRDVDPYETYVLKELGIKSFNMTDVENLGMKKILEQTLSYIPVNSKLHISFDIDALDTTVAPSTGTRVDGGLTLREGIQIMETIAGTNRIQGVDLVEVNPKLGTENDVQLTVSAGLEVLKAAFGSRRDRNLENIKEFSK